MKLNTYHLLFVTSQMCRGSRVVFFALSSHLEMHIVFTLFDRVNVPRYKAFKMERKLRLRPLF